jgi:hypothetical protein
MFNLDTKEDTLVFNSYMDKPVGFTRIAANWEGDRVYFTAGLYMEYSKGVLE